MTSRELLLCAADYIEKHGLHKGSFWPGSANGLPPEDGAPCCALGAIRVCASPNRPKGVIPADLHNNPVANAAVRWLQWTIRWYQPEWVDVATWNDRDYRTKDEVVDTLRRAAKEYAP